MSIVSFLFVIPCILRIAFATLLIWYCFGSLINSGIVISPVPPDRGSLPCDISAAACSWHVCFRLSSIGFDFLSSGFRASQSSHTADAESPFMLPTNVFAVFRLVCDGSRCWPSEISLSTRPCSEDDITPFQVHFCISVQCTPCMSVFVYWSASSSIVDFPSHMAGMAVSSHAFSFSSFT